MFGAIAGRASRSSPNRRGRSSRASTMRSDQRSPTRSRAAWRPLGGAYAAGDSLTRSIVLDGPCATQLRVVCCDLQPTTQSDPPAAPTTHQHDNDAEPLALRRPKETNPIMTALQELSAALRSVHEAAAPAV